MKERSSQAVCAIKRNHLKLLKAPARVWAWVGWALAVAAPSSLWAAPAAKAAQAAGEAAAETASTGLAGYESLLWIIFYSLIGLLVLIVAWEIIVQVQLRKYGDDDSPFAVTGDNLRETPDEPGATSSTPPPVPDGDDPFKALLSKAGADEALETKRKAPEVIRRGEKPSDDVPIFDGASTIPVGVNAARSASEGQARPNTGGDSASPFQRLANIGSEEGPAASAKPARSSAIVPPPAFSGDQTVIAAGLAKPSAPSRSSASLPTGGGGEEDPWKKLLGQSVASVPKRPSAGGIGLKPEKSSAVPPPPPPPPSVPLGGSRPKDDDPWKALLGGMGPQPGGPGSKRSSADSIPGKPAAPIEPPAGGLAGVSPAANSADGWPKPGASKPRGISLDIKRGPSRANSLPSDEL